MAHKFCVNFCKLIGKIYKILYVFKLYIYLKIVAIYSIYFAYFIYLIYELISQTEWR